MEQSPLGDEKAGVEPAEPADREIGALPRPVAADATLPRAAVLAGFTEAVSRAGFDQAIILASEQGVETGLAAQATAKGRPVD